MSDVTDAAQVVDRVSVNGRGEPISPDPRRDADIPPAGAEPVNTPPTRRRRRPRCELSARQLRNAPGRVVRWACGAFAFVCAAWSSRRVYRGLRRAEDLPLRSNIIYGKTVAAINARWHR